MQLCSLVFNVFDTPFSDDVGTILESWEQLGRSGQELSTWPTDLTKDILPVRCHSHNDYWRNVPLYSAISAGCISVEADVWLYGEELYVGHSYVSLTRKRTLNSLYIEPLLEILAKQNPTTEFHPNGNTSRNGVFDTDPSQSLTVLIDFKTSGPELWPYIKDALEPLRARGYLTHHNGKHFISGPVTVVASGDAPFDLIKSNISNSMHDVYYDAPLEELWEEANVLPDSEGFLEGGGSAEEDAKTGDRPWGKGKLIHRSSQQRSDSHDSAYRFEAKPRKNEDGPSAMAHPDIYTSANSYYASVSFRSNIGWMWRHRLSHDQMRLIRGQIRGAHRRGLVVRYWELPSWPISLRNHIWDVLMKEGVDVLNVDDLRAATRGNWRLRARWT